MPADVLFIKLGSGSQRLSAWCRTQKMHEAVHVIKAWGRPPTCMRPYTYFAWGHSLTLHEAVHEPSYFPHFLLYEQYLEPMAVCIWIHKVRQRVQIMNSLSWAMKISFYRSGMIHAITVHELFSVYGYTQWIIPFTVIPSA